MAGSDDPQQPLLALELRVLARWRERGVARAAQVSRAGAPARVIWELPAAAGEDPAADLGARILADVFARYATMRGWLVDRRGARDCHAAALELAVARELGFASKARIEEAGIAGLTARCREAALASAAALDAASERLGLQAVAPSRTLDAAYVESVWWAVKEIADQGLLLEDVRVVDYCPRCATALGADDVAPGQVAGHTAHVRFRVARDGGPLQAGDELLVQTTAPWTLLANAAVAVDPELTYVRAKTGTLEAPVVVAEALAEQVLGNGRAVRILERFPGAAIDGLRYEPPFGYLPAAAFGERGHTVLLAGFVTATEGTGIVSVAPAFGSDDLRLATRYGLALINPVGTDGTFDERTGRYAGRVARDADRVLIDDLRARGRLLRAEGHEHTAALCGHCAAPLLAYAKASWYVASSGGRGEEDRLLSYERFWGAPLPVWRCEDGHVTVVGSFEELEQRSGSRLEDPHRPYVDDIALTCACGEPATRVADLVAPWFAAGAMPFAATHEPFAGALTLDELYPADLACVPPGRARQWLPALRSVAALLRGSDPAFDHAVRTTPGDTGGEQGSDALRWRALTGQPGAGELLSRISDAYELAAAHRPRQAEHANAADLDRWIRSRLSAAIVAAGERLDDFDAAGAAGAVAAFADDLCGWYVHNCSERLLGGEEAACRTLRGCLATLARLLAPFAPFLADELYEELDGSEPSVHLGDWPLAGVRDLELEAAVGLAREA